MLPQATASDAGTATPGTIYGGAFTGPDSFLETNQTFLTIARNVVLKDAIAQLSSGGAPSNAHAYLISVGNLQNVIAVLYSTQLPPNSQFRHVPPLRFNQGDIVFVRGVQLAGTAAEATQLVLSFA